MNEHVTLSDAAELTKAREGYRGYVYLDSEGVPTCGWGHALHVDSPVPLPVAVAFFQADWREVIRTYSEFKFRLDTTRRSVVLDMLFVLGQYRFSLFRKFIAAVWAEDFDRAADEIIDSKWHHQLLRYKKPGIETRTEELARIMRTGRIKK